MSIRRTFLWRHGGLTKTSVSQFFEVSLTAQDPEIPNLPLETQFPKVYLQGSIRSNEAIGGAVLAGKTLAKGEVTTTHRLQSSVITGKSSLSGKIRSELKVGGTEFATETIYPLSANLRSIHRLKAASVTGKASVSGNVRNSEMLRGANGSWLTAIQSNLREITRLKSATASGKINLPGSVGILHTADFLSLDISINAAPFIVGGLINTGAMDVARLSSPVVVNPQGNGLAKIQLEPRLSGAYLAVTSNLVSRVILSAKLTNATVAGTLDLSIKASLETRLTGSLLASTSIQGSIRLTQNIDAALSISHVLSGSLKGLARIKTGGLSVKAQAVGATKGNTRLLSVTLTSNTTHVGRVRLSERLSGQVLSKIPLSSTLRNAGQLKASELFSQTVLSGNLRSHPRLYSAAITSNCALSSVVCEAIRLQNSDVSGNIALRGTINEIAHSQGILNIRKPIPGYSALSIRLTGATLTCQSVLSSKIVGVSVLYGDTREYFPSVDLIGFLVSNNRLESASLTGLVNLAGYLSSEQRLTGSQLNYIINLTSSVTTIARLSSGYVSINANISGKTNAAARLLNAAISSNSGLYGKAVDIARASQALLNSIYPVAGSISLVERSNSAELISKPALSGKSIVVCTANNSVVSSVNYLTSTLRSTQITLGTIGLRLQIAGQTKFLPLTYAKATTTTNLAGYAAISPNSSAAVLSSFFNVSSKITVITRLTGQFAGEGFIYLNSKSVTLPAITSASLLFNTAIFGKTTGLGVAQSGSLTSQKLLFGKIGISQQLIGKVISALPVLNLSGNIANSALLSNSEIALKTNGYGTISNIGVTKPSTLSSILPIQGKATSLIKLTGQLAYGNQQLSGSVKTVLSVSSALVGSSTKLSGSTRLIELLKNSSLIKKTLASGVIINLHRVNLAEPAKRKFVTMIVVESKPITIVVEKKRNIVTHEK